MIKWRMLGGHNTCCEEIICADISLVKSLKGTDHMRDLNIEGKYEIGS
jgi:hypothetical protein